MPTNNNFSVLPWYSSPEEQNARKWWVYGRVYPLFTPMYNLLPFQLMREHRDGGITTARLYTRDGTYVGEYASALIDAGLRIVSFPSRGYDVIVYNGRTPVFTDIEPGQYYMVMGDLVDTWCSEVFTCVQDMSPYLMLEWWDDEDFIMDAGTIVYKYGSGTTFRNRAYLQADIAKPEYIFEEEGETRDGYFFPVKQISEKRYRFSFLASEYLLDALRFVRMADHVRITKGGKEYTLDTFLLSPTWEDNGDVASVDVEFDTDTVAKKLWHGYIHRGDFNGDYNSDFDNET